jgi:hypothetical protein
MRAEDDGVERSIQTDGSVHHWIGKTFLSRRAHNDNTLIAKRLAVSRWIGMFLVARK